MRADCYCHQVIIFILGGGFAICAITIFYHGVDRRSKVRVFDHTMDVVCVFVWRLYMPHDSGHNDLFTSFVFQGVKDSEKPRPSRSLGQKDNDPFAMWALHAVREMTCGVEQVQWAYCSLWHLSCILWDLFTKELLAKNFMELAKIDQ